MQQQMMNNLVMTQAPIQMPRNPPFTSYLRLPQPKPTVQGTYCDWSAVTSDQL